MSINEEAVAVVQNGAVPMERTQAVQIVHNLSVDGLLMPDLPEPTFITGNAVVWKNDGDEVFLDGGEIFISSAIRSPERSQRLALTVLAAANYAERNQE